MDKSYQMTIEHTAVKGGTLLQLHGSAYHEFARLTADATLRCSDPRSCAIAFCTSKPGR